MDALPQGAVVSNPRAESAVEFLGSASVRRAAYQAFPRIQAEAACRGFMVNNYFPRLDNVKLLGTSKKVDKGLKKGVVTAVLYMSPSIESYTPQLIAHIERGMAAKKAGVSPAQAGRLEDYLPPGVTSNGLPGRFWNFEFRGLCGSASKECSAACLGHGAGQLAMADSMNARLWKTILYTHARPLFHALLSSEVSNFKRKVAEKAAREGSELVAAVRLDGSTDVGYARVIAAEHPDVQWYDYTKDYGRTLAYLDARSARAPRARGRRLATTHSFPPNWHLTFSYSGHNMGQALDVLSKGGNVAVVFDADPRTCDAIPASWHGFPVIDADETDIRFWDEPGHVAGLRFKKSVGRLEAMEAAGAFVSKIPGKPLILGPFSSQAKAVAARDKLRATEPRAVVRGHRQDRSLAKRSKGKSKKTGGYTYSGGWVVDYKLPPASERMLPPLEKAANPYTAAERSYLRNVLGENPRRRPGAPEGLSGDQIKHMMLKGGTQFGKGRNRAIVPLKPGEVAKALGIKAKDVRYAMKHGIKCADGWDTVERWLEGIRKAAHTRKPVKDPRLSKKKNPLLAIVGNPVAGAEPRSRVKTARSKKTSKKAKKNRVATPGKKKKPLKKKRYSIAEARREFDGYEEALSAFKEFHGRGNNPARVDLYALDDGQDEVRVEPMHVALYRQLETNYMVPWRSNKKGTLWLHEHKEGSGLEGLQRGAPMPRPEDLPLGAYNPRTKVILTMDGKVQVKDWLYD
jgi:hypothetical protein